MTWKECPECNERIEQHDGYQLWCPACDWNLVTDAQPLPQTLRERQYIEVGQRRGRQLFDTLSNVDVSRLRPRWTIADILALLLACSVHAVTVAVLGLALFAIYVDFPNLILMTIGAILLGFVWLLRPRLGRVPVPTLQRGSAPVLFRLLDRMSDKLGGERVEHISIDPDFNAWYTQVGLRRTPVLGIGIPLWLAMSPEQRVAILAHELAHGVNGDATRGVLLGSAIQSLYEWLDFL